MKDRGRVKQLVGRGILVLAVRGTSSLCIIADEVRAATRRRSPFLRAYLSYPGVR